MTTRPPADPPTGPPDVDVRAATPDDVPAVRAFGERHVVAHYAPLIGAEAAHAQVRDWWTDAHLRGAADAGTLVVAESAGHVVGVAQRGRYGDEHVVYKLYVDPALRGRGLGPRLVAALTAALPPGVEQLWIEHFAANERAATFYQREGFTIRRVEPAPDGDARRAVVWRVKRLVTGADDAPR